MMVKERLSSDYMFFRFPSHYALILGTLVAGVTNYFINPKVDKELVGTSDHASILLDYQYNALEVYLGITKLTLAVMCAFFITYRWTVINKDGSYGYLLTQGIDRGKFFFRSASMFILNGYIGILSGILVLNFLGGMYLKLDVFFWLILLSFSSTLLVVSTAIILGETLSLPELSSFIVVIIFGLNTSLNNDDSSIWYKFMKSELLFSESTPILAFILSFGVGSILMVSSYFLHKKLDVEL